MFTKKKATSPLEAEEQRLWKELRREEDRLDNLHLAGAWWEFDAQAARVRSLRERHDEAWKALSEAQWAAEASYQKVR